MCISVSHLVIKGSLLELDEMLKYVQKGGMKPAPRRFALPNIAMILTIDTGQNAIELHDYPKSL